MDSKFLNTTGSKLLFAGVLSAVMSGGGYYFGYQNGQQSFYQPSVFNELQKQHADKVEQEALLIKSKLTALDQQLLIIEPSLLAVSEGQQTPAGTSPVLEQIQTVTEATQLEAQIGRLKQIDVTQGRDFYTDPHRDTPKASSGLPEALVASYEQETGISNADIEKAMNRHK